MRLQGAIRWGDRDTALFVDYGRYFVPERDLQFRIWMKAGHAIWGGWKADEKPQNPKGKRQSENRD